METEMKNGKKEETSPDNAQATGEQNCVVNGHGETILLMDHDLYDLETYSHVLEKLNYTVLTAANGNTAIELYQHHRGEIDVLILDFVLPGAGGREALQAIRSMNPEVKVIFVAAYHDIYPMNPSGNRHSDSDPDTSTVLLKPFSIVELSLAIRNTLGINDARSESSYIQ